ncbi:polymorphic toxin-type HINT domain-containing protein [Actinomadura sp. 1N219]|uniref:polymorphic toxin-type HINT domain-containing protein n=1 Tax=Actinomadura sp. 1N219 TaxID=3375152 RepID=UPI00379E5049
MADGSRKSIRDVRVGDKILTTDPESGRTRTEPVLDTIVSQGDKKLVQITVQTAGPRPFWTTDEEIKKPAGLLRTTAGPKSAVIVATDAHPFWVAGSLNKWVTAADLKPGMWLRTSAGTYVQVTATELWAAQDQRVHNLTVADLHTYYVLAGNTPVLVHNDDRSPPSGRSSATVGTHSISTPTITRRLTVISGGPESQATASRSARTVTLCERGRAYGRTERAILEKHKSTVRTALKKRMTMYKRNTC